ncbi:UNVERIFIED_CONTAM: hypothetical protein Sradi_4850000 [Sesamum radiatum]|uniref:Uncharacterized protein n=1 Tax=Sesamum radiatum TaxID=300843 RepID=A0AAW2N130_SESRA
MEHPPQGRHALGTVGRRCLSQRRISLGLATEEGRFTTPSTACRNRKNHYRLLARPRRQSSTWPNGAAVRDLIRPKHMSTSGRNEQNSLGSGNMEGIHPAEVLIHFVAWVSGQAIYTRPTYVPSRG